jgi:hypothetical protein
MKTLVLILTLSLATPGARALAGDGQVLVTQGKETKTKAKGDRVVVSDKSKPVRQALEEQHAKIADAQRWGDIEALRALRTPDFTVTTANGQTWDLQTSLDYSKSGFEQVDSTIAISNTIDSLTVKDDRAVAVVHQQWTRMQMMKGKRRRVETSVIQTETWVNTADGWRLEHIGNLKPGVWVVDGKRVDPRRPYDPDAPPYEPGEGQPWSGSKR